MSEDRFRMVSEVEELPGRFDASGEARACVATQSIKTIAPSTERLDGALRIEVVPANQLSSAQGLAWDELATSAIVPNPFYERWNLSAAVEHLRSQPVPQLILVSRGTQKADAPAKLCGLFPCTFEGRRWGVTRWSLWGHPYAYLRTPLLRRGQEQEVLGALFDWMPSARPRPDYLDWGPIDADGPVAEALCNAVNERGLSTYRIEAYTRALLRRVADWESIVATELSNHHRRELRRQHRRLSERGELTVRSLRHPRELRAWGEAFQALEASGWKGSSATAMASSTESRGYLTALLADGLREQRLQMLGLFLRGEPIAMKLNLLSGPGAFAFKIAYDEAYAKFSPGVHLELENIRLMHEETSAQWMDSCARANHFMINRLWSRRRMLQRLLISTGGRLGHLAVGAYPMLRACKRTLRPSPSTATHPAKS